MAPEPVSDPAVDEECKALREFLAEGSGYWPPIPDDELFAPGAIDDEDDDEDD